MCAALLAGGPSHKWNTDRRQYALFAAALWAECQRPADPYRSRLSWIYGHAPNSSWTSSSSKLALVTKGLTG